VLYEYRKVIFKMRGTEWELRIAILDWDNILTLFGLLVKIRNKEGILLFYGEMRVF